jgi:hypothetical protein
MQQPIARHGEAGHRFVATSDKQGESWLCGALRESW